MTILLGRYLCETCKHFDEYGIDGNSPSCLKQFMFGETVPVRVGEKCRYGYEQRIPMGYDTCQKASQKHEEPDRGELGLFFDDGGGAWIQWPDTITVTDAATGEWRVYRCEAKCIKEAEE